MYKNALDVRKRVNEHYNEVTNLGYNVVGVFLQGSQNYNLQYENSDVDTKAILLPSFEDFCLNRAPISTTHICENNEHIDLKDIRLMFDCFKKQNVNFVEILFTKYKVVNPKYKKIVQLLLDNKELIAHYNNYAAVNCMTGLSMEKYKALEHPYPATIDKIEKYGYDGKQLCHLVRINEFMKRYIQGTPYAECLVSKIPEYLINLKRNTVPLEEARILADLYNKETKTIKDTYMETTPLLVNREAEEVLNKVLVELIKSNFKSELNK